jgi:hypothetical protein
MDQQFITGGTIFSGIVITGCGLLISPLAIGMCMSYPHEIWYLGLVLSAAAIAMIYGGIKQLVSVKRSQQAVQQTQAAIQAELLAAKVIHIGEKIDDASIEAEIIQKQSTEKTAPAQQVILATWHFTAQEWNAFLRYERKERKLSHAIESVLILILGGLLLLYTRDASPWLAFGISGVIGAIYWIGKYYLSMGSLGAAKPTNEVIITPMAIIINGKYNVLRNENIWLSKAKVKEDKGLHLLEFTYNWATRKGDTYEDFRIPIPVDKLTDAEQIAKVMMEGPET